MRAASSDGEVYVVWTRDGEWGDTQLAALAHRTRDSAVSWCNDQRKLLRGDPIQWTGDEGTSAHCVLGEYQGKVMKETMYYTVEMLKVTG